MKKMFFFILIIFSLFTLFSCKKDEVPVDIFSDGLIQFAGSDTLDHVTSNFMVLLASSSLPGAEIEWTSNNQSIIVFSGNDAIVSRPTSDTLVEITASALFNEEEVSKTFTLTVIGQLEMIVTFNVNGGSVTPNPITLNEIGLIAEPAEPTKEGYTFMGWYQDIQLTNEWIFISSQVTTSMTLYAKWEPVVVLEYVVTFNVNGGSLRPEPQTIQTGNYATEPTAPTKEGYTFDGWYQDEELTTAWNFTSSQVDESITLYAKWNEVQTLEYTVSFISNGGDYTPLDQNILESGYATKPIDPTQENFIFAGWYSDQALTSLFDFELLTVTSNITLYAKWVEEIETGGEVEPGILYIETFTTLSQSGSSYLTFSYTGVNQTVWNSVGARGDQTLDGKAILLAGKIDNSKLSATITGGIENLSFEAVKGFTNINERKIEVLINGVSYGIFTIDPESLTKQSFSIPDIDITGEFTLEFVHITGTEARSQIILDNISWTSYSGVSIPVDEQKIHADHDALSIKTSFLENAPIVLSSSGAYLSSIVWSYTNINNINNSMIDLSNKTVTVPLSGQVTVGLTATLSLGSYTLTKEFTVLLGEGEPLSLSNARLEPNQTILKTTGVITSFYETATGIYFFIEDEEAGLMVFAPASYLSSIVIGNEIIIRGTKTSINGQLLLSTVTMITMIGTETVLVDSVTDPLDLDLYESQMIEISGLLMDNYNASSTSFTLMNIDGAIDLFIPADLNTVLKTSIQNRLSGQPAGSNVTVVANVYRMGNAYSLILIDSSLIEVDTTLNASLIESVLLSHLNFNIPTEVTSNLDLVDSSEVFFDGTITWTSNNTSSISNTGLVVRTASAVSVRMSYQIQITNDIIISGYFDVVVSATSSYSGYYASLSGLTGVALKTELTRIISTGMRTIGYSSTSYVLDETDADPSRPGNILLIYNRASVSGVWDGANTWNKEHVWPQSKLGTASVSDINNLRPSNPQINSNRGNLAFAQGSGTYGPRTGGWFPGEEDKGDVARIIFYMNTRWGLTISTSVIGSLEMFKQWHDEDPVDAFELHRNEQIFINQYNRNPYIDHPELVSLIYGPTVMSYSNGFDVQLDFLGNSEIQVEYLYIPEYQKKDSLGFINL